MKFLLRPMLIGLAVCLSVALITDSLAHDDKSSPKGIGNSAPAGIGGSGPFMSSGVEQVSHLPVSAIGGGPSNVLCNDIWGWTDSLTGKEYAIVGLTNATSFVDISDPYNPQYLGRIMTHTGNASWRDMKVFNDHCYIVSDGNGAHGLQIFDMTELRTADPANPQNITPSAHYDGFTRAHNIAINEETGFAYIVGSNKASGGLHILDLNADPLAPTVAGNFSADGYTHDTQVTIYAGPDTAHVGAEIAFNSNEDTLTIVDVTDKSNLNQLSRVGYTDSEYSHQGWLSFDHQFFFMNDELDESRNDHPTRTHIWDVRDLDNPIYTGFFDGTESTIDHNCYTRGRLIFEGNYSSGMRVLRYSDADNPVLSEVGYLDTYPTNNNVNFNGVWSVFPYFDSGLIVISDRQNGLFVARMESQWHYFTDDSQSHLTGYVPDMDEKDLLAVDVDRDGDDDLICARRGTNGVARRNYFFRNEEGVLTNRTAGLARPFQTADQATDVAAADVNNDGWVDLIVACDGQQPRLLLNKRRRVRRFLGGDAVASWTGFREDANWMTAPFAITPKFQSVAAGDVNGDGAPDLFFSDANNALEDRLLINDGTGKFTDETSSRMGTNVPPTSGFGTKCEIVDLNGDGFNDVLKCSVGSPAYIRMLINDGTGHFNLLQNLPNTSASSFEVADMNGDGRLDIYVVSSNQDYWLRNNSTRADGMIITTRMDVTQSYETSGFGGNAMAVDVDNDGDLDMAVCDNDPELPDCDGSFTILRNDDGTLVDPNDAIPFDWNASGVYDVIWMDIDGDGDQDMVQATCDGMQVFTLD